MKPEKVLLLLCYWLFVGFPMGLFTLIIGPSRWMASLAVRFSWSDTLQSGMQKMVILLYLIFSFLVARWFYKKHLRIKNKVLNWSIFTLLGIIFLFSIFVFSFYPEKLIAISGAEPQSSMQSGKNIEFFFGAYPDKDKLMELKSEGFTAVVSLMSDLVVPAEPKLIRQEEALAREVGIKLIRIPMLPWVSGNEKSITQIDYLARNGKGKYFVHCYLGRDRVNAFRNIVESQGLSTNSGDKSSKLRHLEELTKLERGPYFKLRKDVYLTPLPTDEEFFGFVVGGQFKTVVCLLDSTNPEDKQWIEKEKQMMAQYKVSFFNIPLSGNPKMNEVQQVYKKINALPNPKLIHAFRSDTKNCTLLMQLFKESVKK